MGLLSSWGAVGEIALGISPGCATAHRFERETQNQKALIEKPLRELKNLGVGRNNGEIAQRPTAICVGFSPKFKALAESGREATLCARAQAHRRKNKKNALPANPDEPTCPG